MTTNLHTNTHIHLYPTHSPEEYGLVEGNTDLDSTYYSLLWHAPSMRKCQLEHKNEGERGSRGREIVYPFI